MIREKIAKIGRFVVCAMSFVFMLFLFVFGLRSSFNHWYEEIEEYTELLVPRVKDDFVQNNNDIVTPASIKSTIIVITNATKVIPSCPLNIKNSSLF